MKKLIVLTFICAAVAVSCGKKTMPESDAKTQARPDNNNNNKTEKVEDIPAIPTYPIPLATATPSFNNMKGSQTGMPAGSLDAGKTVYVSRCGSCHALKTPSNYTVEQVYSILKAEIPKAKLNKKEGDDVTAYMVANAKK
jgi:cytochrome c5